MISRYLNKSRENLDFELSKKVRKVMEGSFIKNLLWFKFIYPFEFLIMMVKNGCIPESALFFSRFKIYKFIKKIYIKFLGWYNVQDFYIKTAKDYKHFGINKTLNHGISFKKDFFNKSDFDEKEK